MRKNFLRIGSLLAFFAVILGAFGAHFLETKIGPDQLEVYDTAVQYHFIHALAIILISILIHNRKTSFLSFGGWCFAIGVLFFSGSLYLLSLREWLDFEATWLGPITPLGGTFFIIGWAFLFFSTYQERSTKSSKEKSILD